MDAMPNDSNDPDDVAIGRMCRDGPMSPASKNVKIVGPGTPSRWPRLRRGRTADPPRWLAVTEPEARARIEHAEARQPAGCEHSGSLDRQARGRDSEQASGFDHLRDLERVQRVGDVENRDKSAVSRVQAHAESEPPSNDYANRYP